MGDFENSWWARRPFPDSIVWDVVEAAALIVILFAAFEFARRGSPDGYDYRYGKE